MSNVKKLMMTAAGGEALNVEDVLDVNNIYGNGTSQTITNGIDLSTEGGVIFFKNRFDNYTNHFFASTATNLGTSKLRELNGAYAYTTSGGVTSFNTDGYTVGNDDRVNKNTKDFMAITFRKAAKFFDVVEYTGTGTARTIAHNLGCVPGAMLVVPLDNSRQNNWWMNGFDSLTSGFLQANNSGAEGSNTGFWNNTAPTATHFSVGASNDTNANGTNYLMLLWAHNNGDGEFGPTGDQDIIKCGSYYGGGNPADREINLGFEPQLVWINSLESNSYGWFAVDNVRTTSEYAQNHLRLQNYDDEQVTPSSGRVIFTGKGFRVSGYDDDVNGQNKKFAYIAIRKGPMAEPTSSNDFFDVGTWHDGSYDSTKPAFRTGFKPEFGFWRRDDTYVNWTCAFRSTGAKRFGYLDSTSDFNGNNAYMWDYPDGWYEAGGTNSNVKGWSFGHAQGVFDTTRWKGNGSTSQALLHNLGATPEMIWAKAINSGQNWYVYFPTAQAGEWLHLNDDQPISDGSGAGIYPFSSLSSTGLSVGNASHLNVSGVTYAAALFATKSGISKVGSFTGNNTDGRTIDCGFSSGARFVMIRRIDGSSGGSSHNWFVFDTFRGINAGGDPVMYFNRTDPNNSSQDYIDYDASGFKVNINLNTSPREYIFYAVANP